MASRGRSPIWGLLHGIALAITRWWQSKRGRSRQPESAVGRAVRCLRDLPIRLPHLDLFRAGSLPDALAMLSRIASLTLSLENVTWPLAAVCFGSRHYVRRQGVYTAISEAFARQPFYAHAAALAAVAVTLQLLGGRGARSSSIRNSDDSLPHACGPHHRHPRRASRLVAQARARAQGAQPGRCDGALADFTPERTPFSPLRRHVEEAPEPVFHLRLNGVQPLLADANGGLDRFYEAPLPH